MAAFFERLWFTKPPWRWLFLPLLYPLSVLFAQIARLRRRRFLQNRALSASAGAKASNSATCFRAPVPVIVVGNLSVGGNGKTPMVLWLAEKLRAQGFLPGIVSRGYGGKAPYYPFLLDKTTTPAIAGDEPVLIFQRTELPVAVAPERAKAVQLVLAQGANIILCDDGLQHYQLDRDLELVLIDGRRRFGNGHCLPLGPLREPLARLSCVDLLICNGSAPRSGELAMTLVPDAFINVRTGVRREEHAFANCCAMAGIGDPQRFFTTLERLGIKTTRNFAFSDHHDFDLATLLSLVNDEQPLLMTEKDAVKCRQFAIEEQIDNWWYLPVNASFSAADSEKIMQKINLLR
ncbi:MAG: tetraacyldisaccharide 4'-kinase [Vibrionaceae bacterium]